MIICASKKGQECQAALLQNIESVSTRFDQAVKEVVPESLQGQDVDVKGTSDSLGIDALLDTLQNAVVSHFRDGKASAYGWRVCPDHDDTLCISVAAEKEEVYQNSSVSKIRGGKAQQGPSAEVRIPRMMVTTVRERFVANAALPDHHARSADHLSL